MVSLDALYPTILVGYSRLWKINLLQLCLYILQLCPNPCCYTVRDLIVAVLTNRK